MTSLAAKIVLTVPALAATAMLVVCLAKLAALG